MTVINEVSCVSNHRLKIKIEPPRVFLLIFLAFLVLAFSETNGFALDARPVSDADSKFLEAEFFFHEGKLVSARLVYEELWSRFPESPQAPKTVFRLGQIDYQNKYYSSALRFFKYFMDSFPESTLIFQVRLNIAKCLFHLGSYDKAEPLFQESVKANPDVGQKWQAFVYLGLLDEKRLNYLDAIKKLKKTIERTQFPELKEQAARAIEDIVNKKLSETVLIDVSRKYQNEFPGDLALIKLIEKYRDERQARNYLFALQNFVRQFPAHSLKEEYEKDLDRFQADNSRKMRLGTLLPLSGRRALVGQQVLQGIQLAFSELSAKEKSGIELIVKDSGSGESVVQLMDDLGRDPHVVGVVGPVLSREVRDISPFLEKYRLPVFTPTASASGLPELSPYIFRNALTKETQATFLARYAVNELNLYRFVVVFPTEPYGETMKNTFVNEVKSLGGHIVESLPYDRNQTDFRKQILKIGGMPDDRLKGRARWYLRRGIEPPPLNDKGVISRPMIEGGLFSEEKIEGLKISLDLNYDAIFIPGFYDKVGLIISQLYFYNIDNIPMLGGSGWNSPELVEHARNYLKTAIFVDAFSPDSDREEIRKFVDDFIASFGETPTLLSAQSYDAAKIYLKVIHEGAGNRLEVQKALYTIRDYPGVSGATTILPSGDSEKVLLKLSVQGGEIVSVE